MTYSRVLGRRAGVGVGVLLLLAVASSPAASPSITARAAPTVSAAPAAVVAPPASPAPTPVAGGAVIVLAPAETTGIVVQAGVTARPGGALWTWPVDPPHDLLRSFEAPAGSYGAGHRGIDVVAVSGSVVRAPAAGVVSFSGVVVDRPVLSIQHRDDLVSSVEPVIATVSVGERVSAGQVVGLVGAGAHCSGRCVHFGVRRHGQYISPLLFLGGIRRAVLLPVGSPEPR